MRLHWLRDRALRKQFKIIWEKGALNRSDYHTKHHPLVHHRKTRSLYVRDSVSHIFEKCFYSYFKTES